MDFFSGVTQVEIVRPIVIYKDINYMECIYVMMTD